MDKLKYKPTKRKKVILSLVKNEITEFVSVRNKIYPEFNDRTLVQFLDDGDKRLNSYVLSRSNQGKEAWQSNVAMPTVRNKLKKMIAGFSLKVPDMAMKVFGKDGSLDLNRAFIADNLVKGSYLRTENPIISNFWEVWEGASKGTIVRYEGFLKSEYEQKYIKSYDIVTGEIEVEKRTVNPDDECISIQVPLTEIFFKDFYINDIQDQPSIAWVQYLSEQEFNREFGKYADAKFVKVGIPTNTGENDTSSFFYALKRKEKEGDRLIEVIRLYNSLSDEYIITANGVVLLDAPMLWSINGKKVYPFAKSIWEPFVNKNFMYGNSLPNILMGEYDIYNTLWNSVLDKEYRSLVRPLLIGRANQDQFDLEDEFLDTSTKIYVNDIKQVQPMMTNNVEQSDILMIRMIASGIEETAPSLPNTLSNKASTAREVVIAEEKLRELKVINQQLVADLWRQKYALRLSNIQLNYPQPRKIIGDNGKEEKIDRVYLIDNIVIDNITGEIGLLGIQFKNIKDEDSKKISSEISIEEEAMKKQGINYRKLIIPRNYLDNYKYQIDVVPESLIQQSKAKLQIQKKEEIGMLIDAFPEIFMSNKKGMFFKLLEAYDDTENATMYLRNYDIAKEQQRKISESNSKDISTKEDNNNENKKEKVDKKDK